MLDPIIAPMPRRTRSISAEAAAHLQRLIVSGTLAPGDRLPSERDLAAGLGVSRATIREALADLESKRLVVRRRGSGSVVADRDHGDRKLHDTLAELDVESRNASELRDLVEPRIAALAALRATASNVLQLEEVLLQSNERLDADESLRLDREFHTVLAHAAQNPLLVSVSVLTGEWTASVRARSHSSRHARRVSIDGHRAIVQAVLAGDAAAAEAAMTAHLRDVGSLIADDVRVHGGRSDGSPVDGSPVSA